MYSQCKKSDSSIRFLSPNTCLISWIFYKKIRTNVSLDMDVCLSMNAFFKFSDRLQGKNCTKFDFSNGNMNF